MKKNKSEELNQTKRDRSLNAISEPRVYFRLKKSRDFPGSPVVMTLLPMQGAWV